MLRNHLNRDNLNKPLQATNRSTLVNKSPLSDNTFRKAINLGVLRSSSSPVTFRTKGKVGSSDPVDIYKFTVKPGAYFPTNTFKYNIKGGSLKLDLYLKNRSLTNNRIEYGGGGTLSDRGSYFDQTLTYNTTSSVMTVYIKLSNPTQNIRYITSNIYNPL